MAFNRPLFDDDNLPAWLTNAGITGAGSTPIDEPAASGSSYESSGPGWDSEETSWETQADPVPEHSGYTGTLPWFSSEDEPAEQAAPAASEDLPWASDLGSSEIPESGHSAFITTEPSEVLPWEQAQPEADIESSSSVKGAIDDLDWGQFGGSSTTEPAETPDTNPWLQDAGSLFASEPAAEPEAPLAESAFDSGASDDWLNQLDSSRSQPPSKPVPISESSPQAGIPADDDLGWLNSGAGSEPPPEPPAAVVPPSQPTIKKLTPSQPPASDAPPASGAPSQSGIKKLPPKPQPPAESGPATPASQPSIRKLPTKPLPAAGTPPANPPAIKKLPTGALPPQPDYSNMTYEEWERMQIAKEEEAQADPGDKLLEEIPDWFASGAPPLPDAPAADAAPAGAELMPEWFLGMEEQKTDAPVPDWFSNVGLGTSPLVGPDTVKPAQPESPAASSSTPAAPSADDVPDWFKGESPVSDIDFESMFVQPTEPEPPKSKSKITGRLAMQEPAPPAPEPEAQAPQVAPVDAVPAVPTAAIEQPETPSIDELDWLNEAPEFTAPSNPPVEKAATPPPANIAPPPEPAKELDWMDELPDFGTVVKSPLDTGASAEGTLPVADDLLSDLDWLSEPVERKPTGPLNPVPSEPSKEMEPLDTLLDNWLDTGELKSAEAEAAPEVAEAAPAGDDLMGSLDWMNEAEPSQSEMDFELPDLGAPVEAPADDDMPEWMRDMAPSLAGTEQRPDAAASESDDIDWLAAVDFTDMPAEGTQAPAQPAAGAKSESKPKIDPKAPGAKEAQSADQGQKMSSLDIDSLLSLSSPESLALNRADQPPSAIVAPQPEIDLDLESNDLDAILAAPPSAPAGLESLPASDLSSLDEILGFEAQTAAAPKEEAKDDSKESQKSRRLTRLTPLPDAADAAESEQPAASQQSAEVLPDWVENLKPTEGPVVFRIGDQKVQMQEEPLGTVPEAIRRIRDRGAASAQPKPAAAPPPEAGPLSGITEAIPIIQGAITPGELTSMVHTPVSEQHARRVSIIQGILELEEQLLKQRAAVEEPTPETEAALKAAPRIKRRLKLDRILMTLLLAVAVVAPFFTDALNLVAAPGFATLSPVQDSVAKTVDSLQPDQPVLVAFEYGPTGAGELDLLARTIIRDILKHKARPVIVSTNPSGVMHAQALMNKIGTETAELKLIGRDPAQPLRSRQDYVVLRYLPGGATGVRALVDSILQGGLQSQIALSTDVEGQAVDSVALKLTDVKSTPAFVLVETPEDVRNWAEQFRAGAGNKPLQVVFLASASASATAQAYVGSSPDRTIIGPLVGLKDTLIYQQARGLTDLSTKAANQRWQSVGLAGLLAVVLILFSSIFNLIRSLRRRESR